MYGRSSTNPHSSVCHGTGDSRHTWACKWYIHVIGFIIAVIYFALVLLAIGTVLALFTSWRDGCLGRDVAEIKTGLVGVYLRIKNFLHRKT